MSKSGVNPFFNKNLDKLMKENCFILETVVTVTVVTIIQDSEGNKSLKTHATLIILLIPYHILEKRPKFKSGHLDS